ncbi:MAG: flagellin, partial [Bosea sp. (in: a-proteobacteria)]
PRTTAPLQIDASQMVGTGARANEQAFRIGMAQFAALAAETFSATDVNARDRYEALAQRGRSNLSYQNGAQAPSEIAVELATAQTAMKNAKERHSATKIYLTAANSKIEDVSVEEVASSILTLQTRLQASYQTTSILSRLSLTEYLR